MPVFLEEFLIIGPVRFGCSILVMTTGLSSTARQLDLELSKP